MFRKLLIAANAVLVLTACTLPFAKDRTIEGALDRFEQAYSEKYGARVVAAKDREVVAQVLSRVKDRYVDEVSADQLIDAAVKSISKSETDTAEPLTEALNAMMGSLDPYSAYMSPDAYSRYQSGLEGKFVGFGVRIEMRDGKLTVITPIKGSPAYEAGVQPNDIISHLDGEPLTNMTLAEAVEKLRGPSGTRAVLTIVRPNVRTPLQLSLVRSDVDLDPVEYRVDGDVGYIRIHSFNRKTADSVDEALSVFQAKLGSSLCGVILDMRNNPGGLVTAAVDIADEFMNSGNIFAAENRGIEFSEEYAEDGDRINGKPILIMMNKGSASAAEIVAGALQNQKRAQVFGEQSYGKGTMQTLYNLDNGGGLRFTTGRFTAGGGKSFNGVGIRPDIEDISKKDENELAPIARAGVAMNCHLSVQTAASATTTQ
ncbi:S41 family peptidase [Sneathiella limimaris]|uniref:S41 family peptidase n=1 Tax=Sneathiella limimaris TaxID=1964213 RepID=UPI00146D3742|nr:S41 family peptidase [Sneathiella limimaris]